MSRTGRFFPAAFFILILAMGCSVGSTPDGAEPDVTVAAPTTKGAAEGEANESATNSPEAESPSEKTNAVQAKLNALAADIANEDPQLAIRKMRVIFDAADNNPSGLAEQADTLARLVSSKTKNDKTKQYAQRYLIFASVRDGESDSIVAKQLAAFYQTHKATRAPIDLYRALADRLANEGDGPRALRFLDHGIRVCAKHPQATTLEKHRRMTQQTMMLLGHTRNTSVTTSASEVKDKATTQRTKSNPKYARFKGKRPRISGRTLDGSSLSSSATRGKWTYVHFWATWCGACRNATPSVVSLQRRFEKQGVKFVGVNLDSDQAAARKFIKKHKLDWPHLSGNGAMGLAKSVGVEGIPVSLFLSPDGTVVTADRTGGGELKKQIEFSLGFDKGLKEGLKKSLDRLKKSR